MMSDMAHVLRSKKLAILMRDARMVAGRSKKECAAALGISKAEYKAYENAEATPSLPEIEALAYFLDVPVNHFWGSKALSEASPRDDAASRIAKSLELRRKIIGVKLQQLREAAGLSLEALSRQSGIETRQLRSYETGDQPVPVSELERLAGILNTNFQDFSGGQGPVGEWMRSESLMRRLKEMPNDLQDFISKPINQPYLEIAHRLSTMDVHRLRTVAEGLLDITL